MRTLGEMPIGPTMFCAGCVICLAARRPLPTIACMCNLHQERPWLHIEAYFRSMVPAYSPAAVGPFGTGLFLRPADGQLYGVRSE